MGFYGNITNTSKTQFQFDKIYSSRYDMESQARTDGIYAGRYVLVEYDTDLSQDSFYRVFINDNNGQMYNAPGVTAENNKITIGERLEFSDPNKGAVSIVPVEAFVFTADGDDTTRKYTNIVYYKVTGDLYKQNKDNNQLIKGNYKQVTADKTISPDGLESTVSNYTKNYAIDNEKYGAGRGYDSTVWQKAYIDNVEKYIMIAELNSVVPTFGVSADAPTAEPIAPHFDTQSTDLYYKLHWQPAWGMRIAEGKLPDAEKPGEITTSKDPDHGNYPSDEDVSYSKLKYNSATKEIEEDEQQPKVNYKGAIYYNKAGFEDYKHTYYNGSFKDKISVQPLGISGMKYNEHGNSIKVSAQPDIQEISIMLPSLGNALCDIWDKVYGYNPKNDNKRYRDIEWKDANPKKQEDGTLVYEKFTGKVVPSKDENYQGNTDLGDMTRSPETIAGCINMAHDLMGMILTTKNLPNVMNKSTDKDTLQEQSDALEEEYQKHYIYFSNNKYYRLYKYPEYEIVTIKWIEPEKGSIPDQERNTNYRVAVDEALKDYKGRDIYQVLTQYDNNLKEWEVKKYNKRVIDQSHPLAIRNGKYWYNLVEIEGFADNLSTINGLIVSLKNLIESDNSDTRNRKTIQGAINALNDIINCFEDLVPGEFLICDSNGKVNSANWTTEQSFGYENLGDSTKSKEAPVKSETNTDEEKKQIKENQWIELSVDESASDKQIKVIHKLVETNDHKQDDTVTESDKNNASFNTQQISSKTLEDGQEFYFNGINNNNDINTLKLYTPIVDNAGHVVGKNTETVTLPYGYKYLETNGRVDEEETDLYTNPIKDNKDNITGYQTDKKNVESTEKTAKAESTQDKIIINPKNKWIQTQITNNAISIAHEVHNIVKTELGTNNNGEVDENGKDKVSEDSKNNIVAYDVEVDAAGHVTKNQKHTYTLPYGYKVIKVTNSDVVTKPDSTIKENGQIADNTQDTLTFSASNGWIKLDNNTKNTIKIGHKLSDPSTRANTDYGLKQNETIGTLDIDNKFEVPCFKFDEAGHIIEASTHTVELPENFDKIAVITNTEESESEVGAATGEDPIKADSLVGTLTFAEGNKWINITPDAVNNKLIFEHYSKTFPQTTKGSTNYDDGSSSENTFIVQEITWDQAGHIDSSDKHTYTLPNGIKNITITNSGISEDSFEGISPSIGTLEAKSLIDTFKINTKNRWIQPIIDTDNKTVSFYHATAGTAKNKSTDKEQTPGFGKTFNIPVINWDTAGHVTSASTQTVTIPSPGGAVTETGSSILTGFTINNDTGAADYTHGNISDLKLTDYEKKPEQAVETKIYTGDTINTAFHTLENLINGYKDTISNFATRIESYESTITNLKGRIEQLEEANNPTV